MKRRGRADTEVIWEVITVSNNSHNMGSYIIWEFITVSNNVLKEIMRELTITEKKVQIEFLGNNAPIRHHDTTLHDMSSNQSLKEICLKNSFISVNQVFLAVL